MMLSPETHTYPDGKTLNIHRIGGQPFVSRAALEQYAGLPKNTIGTRYNKWCRTHADQFRDATFSTHYGPRTAKMIPLHLAVDLADRWKDSALVARLRELQNESGIIPFPKPMAPAKPETFEITQTVKTVEPMVSDDRESAIIWLVKELMEARAALDAQNPEVQRELEATRAQVKKLEAEFRVGSLTVGKLQVENTDLRTEVKRLQDELEFKGLEVEELTQQLETLKKNIGLTKAEQAALALSGYRAS